MAENTKNKNEMKYISPVSKFHATKIGLPEIKWLYKKVISLLCKK